MSPTTKKKAAIAKRKATVDSVQLAREAVDKFFDQITADFNQIQQGNGVRIADCIDAIAEAVAAESGVKKLPEDDAEYMHYVAEASYLVGVQVGLRLRPEGGA